MFKDIKDVDVSKEPRDRSGDPPGADLLFGTPANIEGACNARQYLTDDYMNHQAIFRCERTPGHDGPHSETLNRPNGRTTTITWTEDDREDT